MSALRFSTSSGIEIAYEARGSGEPLVLLHGWTGFRQDFESHFDALSASHRLLVPDMRGHGESTHTGDPASYTFEALVQDLVGFMAGVAEEPCHLLGHSMGGMIALRAALAKPAAIRSLLLMDTNAEPLAHTNQDALQMAGTVAREQGMAALAQILRNLETRSPTRTPAVLAHEARAGEDYWAWRAARISAIDPQAYDTFVHAMVEQTSQVARLPEIAVPTLVMVGSQDREFLQPSGILAAGIPDAWLLQIPGAAHQPQYEAPERWLEAIRIHLARVA